MCYDVGVIFVPAFNGILAPHWRDDARGIILGLSNYTNTAHIVRAMLEAICWQVGPASESFDFSIYCNHQEALKSDVSDLPGTIAYSSFWDWKIVKEVENF